MKGGLTLLKTFESTLLQLKYEDLLHFLINDLVRSGFFQNNNYENYLRVSSTVKIKTELMNNLENENIQDIKIREIEERAKKSEQSQI
jgi:hypothetical protein